MIELSHTSHMPTNHHQGLTVCTSPLATSPPSGPSSTRTSGKTSRTTPLGVPSPSPPPPTPNGKITKARGASTPPIWANQHSLETSRTSAHFTPLRRTDRRNGGTHLRMTCAKHAKHIVELNLQESRDRFEPFKPKSLHSLQDSSNNRPTTKPSLTYHMPNTNFLATSIQNYPSYAIVQQ